MMDSRVLDHIAQPRSVAIVGASEDPRKMGGAALRNLLNYRFPGEIHAINRSRRSVQGVRAFPSLRDCPTVPDTVVIAVPAADVLPVVTEMAELGIGSATVVSAGFSEGAAGKEPGARTAHRGHVIGLTTGCHRASRQG